MEKVARPDLITLEDAATKKAYRQGEQMEVEIGFTYW